MFHLEANAKHSVSGTKQRAKYALNRVFFFLLVDKKLVQWKENKDPQKFIIRDI